MPREFIWHKKSHDGYVRHTLLVRDKWRSTPTPTGFYITRALKLEHRTDSVTCGLYRITPDGAEKLGKGERLDPLKAKAVEMVQQEEQEDPTPTEAEVNERLRSHRSLVDRLSPGQIARVRDLTLDQDDETDGAEA